MKIAVFVKQVPDSAAKINVENGQVNWGDAPLVINPWDEYAVEAALQLGEAHNAEVTALSLGGESAKDALKHALAMGCSDAILISDPKLAGLDAGAASQLLAAAVKKLGEVDLAIFGKQAIDSDTGLTPAMTGRILGWPVLSLVAKVAELDPSAATLKIERNMEEGRQIVESRLPAVLSIAKDYGEPRYPSFMGIRKASKAEIPGWSLADLGMEAASSHVAWPELIKPAERELENEIITGESPAEIAAKLAEKIIEAGVL